MTDNRLKTLAERIERLMDERDGIQSDIRDIYAEAKSAGYVPKVLRKAITRKRMDPDKREEEDTILDLYEDALSPKMRRAVQMAAAGATSREIEAETGLDHVTVARSVSLNKKSATPHDADGVVTETQESCGGAGSPSAEDADGPLRVGAVRIGAASSPEVAPGPHDASLDHAHNEVQPPAPRSVGAVVREPATERGAPTPFMGDDPGEIPAHLRGPSPANRSLRP